MRLDESDLPAARPTPWGVLAYARQAVQIGREGWLEGRTDLFLLVVTEAGERVELRGGDKADLVRQLLRASLRREAAPTPSLLEHMRGADDMLAQQLRVPTEAERANGLRLAVFPLAAVIVG